MKNRFAAFSFMIILAGCAVDQAPPPAHAQQMLAPKMMFDVQTISLADRSGLPPASSPYATNHFSPTIADAIKQWGGDRLQAVGQNGQAMIVIKDASLMEMPLQTPSGVDSWFTRSQGVKYIGHADVSIEANGRPGFAMADAVATRSVTLPENPTAIEKQDAYYTLLNGLMKDLGQNLESGIQMHMNSFVIRDPSYPATSISTPIGASTVQTADAPIVIQSPMPSPVSMAPALATSSVQAAPLAPPQDVTLSQAATNNQVQSYQPQGYQAQAYQPQPYQTQSQPQQLAPLPPAAPVFGNTTVPTVPDATTGPTPVVMPPSYVATASPNVQQLQPMMVAVPAPAPMQQPMMQMPATTTSTYQPATIPLSGGYGQ